MTSNNSKEPIQMLGPAPASQQSLADRLPNGTPDDLLMMLGAKDAALSLRVGQIRQLEARIAQLEARNVELETELANRTVESVHIVDE